MTMKMMATTFGCLFQKMNALYRRNSCSDEILTSKSSFGEK